MSSEAKSVPNRPITLEELKSEGPHEFSLPVKKIHDGPDVEFFLTSFAYRDLMTFILQLNHAMVPRKAEGTSGAKYQTWPIGSEAVVFSPQVRKLGGLISKLEAYLEEAPPDPGPRRFGNVSFRKWYSLVEGRAGDLLTEHIDQTALQLGSANTSAGGATAALDELQAYFLGSFGSPQRLDYGTGHELSFVAFLGCLWKLDGFATDGPGVEERGIVLGVFQPYLSLVRKVIETYTLEPAGSHGVWGLDDNSFIPYLFGSAQLSPAISDGDETPLEGSIPDSPEPSSVTKLNVVQQERHRNLYFSAIGFIYDVKKGPFWEHSPVLFDISGIKAGWGKINKGMIKMYNAEVLSKFPVVQHFPFGSLFRWEKDPDAVPPPRSTHASSQPLRNPLEPTGTRRPPGSGTAAPHRAAPTSRPPVGMVDGVTRAPWASRTPAPPSRMAVPSRAGPTSSGPASRPAGMSVPPLSGTREEKPEDDVGR